MKKILKKMSDQELKEYEQRLLDQWTPRIALEVQIDKLSSERTELVEVINNLSELKSLKNIRLVQSVINIKYKLENLEDKLDDLIQDSKLTFNNNSLD